MTGFWHLSLRNLRRNMARNVATGSAIAFGFAGITMLGAYSHRVSNYIRVHTMYAMHTGHLQIHKKEALQKFYYSPKKYSLAPADQERILAALASEPTVEKVEKQLTAFGLIGNGCQSFPFVAKGIDPEVDRWALSHPEMQEWLSSFVFYRHGRGLWNYPEEFGAVTISEGLSKGLGKTKVHDEVGDVPVAMMDCATAKKEDFAKDTNVQLLAASWTGSMSALDGESVARFSTGFRESDNSAIQMSVTRLQQLLETDNVSQVVVWLKDRRDIPAVKASLEAKLPDLEISPWNTEAVSPYYVGTVQFLYSLVTFIGIVLAAIIAFSVLNSATMTILERSQEIGMYRSFGFQKRHVHQLFLRECLWLSAFGLLGGAVIGYAAVTAINAAKIHYRPPGISEGMQLVLIWDSVFSWAAALAILLLVLGTTYFAVSRQLKAGVADLLIGVKR